MAEKQFSFFLSKLLRHDAKSRGLNVSPEGYVDVSDVLTKAKSSGLNKSEDTVRRIVENDSKGRFKLRNHDGKLQIKATQGHTFQVSDTELTPVTRPSDVKVVLHGTRSTYWSSIKEQGLSRKRRTHIHFAQGESHVKSGFPPNCDIVIEINIPLALQAGIKFYTSENDVVLSPGNKDGVIPTRFFKNAYRIGTREMLSF